MCGSSLSVKGGMVSVIKNYLDYEKWDGIKITYIPTHVEKSKYLLIPFFCIACCRILFLLAFHKVDIMHLHTAERGSFYRKAFLVQISNIFGVKTIMHHHGAEFEIFYDSLSKKKKDYVNRILNLVDVNIVLSKRLVPMIRNKAPEANVVVLYNAVNAYCENPYNLNAKNILFLGRLGERKGVYDLLSAIKKMDADIDKDIMFYLCGDGEIDKVKERITELEIEHRIAHVGWIDGKQKEMFISKTMINVLPSYNEGLPMTILETMAYGIPNVSTAVASIPEVLHDNENGFLICPGEVERLVECIKELINRIDLRKSFSEKSFLLIKSSFSLDASMKEVSGIYKTLIEKSE